MYFLLCFVLGEKKERCEPISHCWTADSKLYCGCKGGQVICVDTETNRVTIVLDPSAQESQRDRTETLSLLRKTTMESIVETEEERGNINIGFFVFFSLKVVYFFGTSNYYKTFCTLLELSSPHRTVVCSLHFVLSNSVSSA